MLSRAMGASVFIGVSCVPVTLSCKPDRPASGGSAVVASVNFRTEFRRLIVLMNGQPVEVTPSPAGCARKDVPSGYEGKPEDWYFGKGECSATYVPNEHSLFSPLYRGMVEHLYVKAAVYDEVRGLLARLTAQAPSASLSPLEKLEVQSTAWELLFGLRSRESISRDQSSARKVDVLLQEAREFFRSTLLTDEEIARLPKTSDLGEKIPGAENLGLLLRHDPDYIEIASPNGLHVSQARGRFYMRILMTVSPDERPRFKKYLLSASDIELVGFPWNHPDGAGPRSPHAGDMRAFSSMFGGVRGILLLFFNAVNTRMEMVPTGVIASWQEYRVDGRMPDDLEAASKQLECRSVNYVRRVGFEPGDESPGYSVADVNDLVPLNDVFDVNPLRKLTVTTRRGACLEWHRTTASFDRMKAPARLRFTAPFVDTPEEILRTGVVYAGVGKTIRSLLDGH